MGGGKYSGEAHSRKFHNFQKHGGGYFPNICNIRKICNATNVAQSSFHLQKHHFCWCCVLCGLLLLIYSANFVDVRVLGNLGGGEGFYSLPWLPFPKSPEYLESPCRRNIQEWEGNTLRPGFSPDKNPNLTPNPGSAPNPAQLFPKPI